MCGVMLVVKLLSPTVYLAHAEDGSLGDYIQTDVSQLLYTTLHLGTPDPTRLAEYVVPGWPDKLLNNQSHF